MNVKLTYHGDLPSKSNFRKSGKDWRKRWARILESEIEIGWLAKAQGAKVTDKPVALTVVLYNQRLDADNSTKIIGDALENICYENDKQVKTWSVGTVRDKHGPRVSIAVSEIEES